MVASLLHILCTLLKASTHSIVLVFDIATGHCCLCSYFHLSLSVSLSCLFTCVHFVNWLYISYSNNKFKAPVWGCTKIPGGECHRLEIQVMENMTWFMCSGRKYSALLLMGVQANHSNSPAHAQCFSCWKRGSRQSWCHLMMSQYLLMHLAGEYIRKVCMNLQAVVWVFGIECFSQFLGGHWPSLSAVSVPLME